MVYVPKAYATCPICSTQIPLAEVKDHESFTGAEAVEHIEANHPKSVGPVGVPYFSITILPPSGQKEGK